ncbi:MAG: hypothetical protein K2X93_00885, partial [Candidatus Obscuribacterales bacterium]|nr:hypothetical protein [Candidatus Obscuribacterales bacterium]
MSDKPAENAKPAGDGQKKDLPPAARDLLLRDALLDQQFKQKARENADIVDLTVEFFHAGLYSGAQAPVRSLAQFYDPKFANDITILPPPEPAKPWTTLWGVQQLGSGAGMALPFMATKGALGKSGLTFAGRTEAKILAGSRLISPSNLGLVADGALTGATYDFFLHPLSEKELQNPWDARLRHGTTGAATFGTLTAGSVLLRHSTRSLAASLAEAPTPIGWKAWTGDRASKLSYDFAMGALPGAPAGLVNAEVGTRLTKNRAPTAAERTEAVLTMTTVGGTLSMFHRIPGSEVPLADIAREYRTRKTATSNLTGMLRAREVAALMTSPEATGTLTGDGAVKLPGSGSDRVVKGKKPTEGKTLGSGDVEVTKETAIPVHRDLQAILQRGADLAYNASEANTTPKHVSDFFAFARGEGKGLRDALLEVAAAYNDPRLEAIVREAYLPPEGVKHQYVDADGRPVPIKIKGPVSETNPGTQVERWTHFMQLVREIPQDVEGYIRFRHDMFRWLRNNPDLHEWAKQYAQQSNSSKPVGPIEYYFATNGLKRFTEVQDGTRPAQEVKAEVKTGSSAAAVAPIRTDLTPEEAEAGRPVTTGDGKLGPGTIDMAGLLGGKDAATGKQLTGDRPVSIDPLSPTNNTRRPIDERMSAFDVSGPTKKRIEAMQLAKCVGEMTTEQFAKWLDYLYEKPANATSDGASNLQSMWIPNRDILLHPEVAEAYKQHRGFGEPGKATVPLEAIRRFLADPPPPAADGKPAPLPDWLDFYAQARLAQARDAAPDGAKPHETLDNALPRWFVELLKGQYVTDVKVAGQAPTYSDALPADLAAAIEAARQTQPPPRKPDREYKPPVNDVTFRLGKLEEVLNVQDPVIRQRLLELGASDHTSLRNILQKLDPSRSAPEYQDLLRMVLPGAKNIGEVKLLLDAIFHGNKAGRDGAGGPLAQANAQLAMAAA